MLIPTESVSVGIFNFELTFQNVSERNQRSMLLPYLHGFIEFQLGNSCFLDRCPKIFFSIKRNPPKPVFSGFGGYSGEQLYCLCQLFRQVITENRVVLWPGLFHGRPGHRPRSFLMLWPHPHHTPGHKHSSYGCDGI